MLEEYELLNDELEKRNEELNKEIERLHSIIKEVREILNQEWYSVLRKETIRKAREILDKE